MTYCIENMAVVLSIVFGVFWQQQMCRKYDVLIKK